MKIYILITLNLLLFILSILMTTITVADKNGYLYTYFIALIFSFLQLYTCRFIKFKNNYVKLGFQVSNCIILISLAIDILINLIVLLFQFLN